MNIDYAYFPPNYVFKTAINSKDQVFIQKFLDMNLFPCNSHCKRGCGSGFISGKVRGFGLSLLINPDQSVLLECNRQMPANFGHKLSQCQACSKASGKVRLYVCIRLHNWEVHRSQQAFPFNIVEL